MADLERLYILYSFGWASFIPYAAEAEESLHELGHKMGSEGLGIKTETPTRNIECI